MPPRFAATQSNLGDILIYDRGVDATTDPIALHLDTTRKNFAIRQRFLPVDPGESGGVQLSEWVWQNGPGGAGTAIETPASYQQGSCAYGENVWLRRVGVAQPAGQITEIGLPPLTAALTGGAFVKGQVFGASGDLFITTANTIVTRITGGTGEDGVQDHFFPSAGTVGITVFNGTGSACLYVGNTNGGILEFDGSSWTTGEAATQGGWLEAPYWVLGDQLATGGAASSAGQGANRLVMSNPQGTSFRHVAGDPKLNANWSAATTVGVGGSIFTFKKVVASNRVVWFATQLGVLGVDGLGYSPNLLKGVELYGGGNTGNVCAYWAGMIWFGTDQGLIAFRPDGSRIDVPTFTQFGNKSGVSPIFGLPSALAPSEDGLYVAYHNADTNTAYVGVLLLESGNLRWSMAEAVIEDRFVTYLQQVVGSDGVTRLFIGAVDSDGYFHLYTQVQPISGDPEMDYKHGGSFTPATNWSVTLSRTDGQRAVRKTMRRLMLEADQLGEDHPLNSVEFQVSNAGGAYVTHGTAINASVDNSRWSSQPIVGTAQTADFQVKLVVASTAADPVIIRTASVLYSLHPDLSRVVQAPVIIGESFDRDPRATLYRLERAQRSGPLYMDDFFGRRIEGTVSVDNETVVPNAEGNGYTVHADVTVLYTRQVARVDAGDLLDCGFVVS